VPPDERLDGRGRRREPVLAGRCWARGRTRQQRRGACARGQLRAAIRWATSVRRRFAVRKEVAVALIGIIPACLTAILGYMTGASNTDANRARSELAEKRLRFAQSTNPNFKELEYPNYGISLRAPRSWTVEDGPARLAGGEFNLVSRYEDTRGAIGINFRLRPVQPNYVNDLAAQIENQRETFETNYGVVAVSDVAISGISGKLFEYQVPTGKRKMAARQPRWTSENRPRVDGSNPAMRPLGRESFSGSCWPPARTTWSRAWCASSWGRT
jgi:hypothetical protein